MVHQFLEIEVFSKCGAAGYNSRDVWAQNHARITTLFMVYSTRCCNAIEDLEILRCLFVYWGLVVS